MVSRPKVSALSIGAGRMKVRVLTAGAPKVSALGMPLGEIVTGPTTSDGEPTASEEGMLFGRTNRVPALMTGTPTVSPLGIELGEIVTPPGMTVGAPTA
jgi:hypothetical protein